uniref:Putative secreted protein n=1 Tax=Anopheles marajoara TaxID=58244 RepID=A0A2M4C7Z1_9DIPT
MPLLCLLCAGDLFLSADPFSICLHSYLLPILPINRQLITLIYRHTTSRYARSLKPHRGDGSYGTNAALPLFGTKNTPDGQQQQQQQVGMLYTLLLMAVSRGPYAFFAPNV